VSLRPGRGCVVLLIALLAGCSQKRQVKTTPPPAPTAETPAATAKQPAEPQQQNPQTAEPGQVPRANARVLYAEVGVASWYGAPYHNRRSSDGHIYDMHAFTAAHKTLPLNTVARVTNLKTGRSTIVRITDRGPFVGDRILDLSLAAAQAVDVWRPGLAEVKLEVLETPAPIESGGRWAVQIGAFHDAQTAAQMKSRLQQRYQTADILQFKGPTGDWIRVRVPGDDKRRAEQVASETATGEGGVFLVRLD
jgi:peptidoglycan lytic transglycosylase